MAAAVSAGRPMPPERLVPPRTAAVRRRELVAADRRRVDMADEGGDHDAGERGERAGEGERGNACARHPDAGAAGRFDVAADRVDVAAEDGSAHQHRERGRERGEDEDRERDAEDAGSGERGEGLADVVGPHMLAGDGREHGTDQQKLHADGDDDRIGAGAVDGEAIDRADGGAHHERQNERRRRADTARWAEKERHHRRHHDHRAGREIELPADEHDRHSEGDDAGDHALLQHRHKIVG